MRASIVDDGSGFGIKSDDRTFTRSELRKVQADRCVVLPRRGGRVVRCFACDYESEPLADAGMAVAFRDAHRATCAVAGTGHVDVVVL